VSLDRTEDAAAADDYPQVVAAPRQKLLHDRAGAAEPRSPLDPRRPRLERAALETADDVSPPAAEARLEDERRLQLEQLVHRAYARRMRVLEAGSVQQLRRSKLVVDGQQRRPTVHHMDTSALERLEQVEPGLHPVQRPADVQADQREVAAAHRRERRSWRQQAGAEPRRQHRVRRLPLMGDDCECHLRIIVASAPTRGIRGFAVGGAGLYAPAHR
jgi:hypothetical protein